jgi:hypothetical protein
VIVAVVVEVTVDVVTVKVTLLDPAGTVTVEGTDALPLFDERVTTSPPGPATPSNVTVPVEEEPPTTDDGDKDTLDTPASITAK